ncbi:uncharacterized protein N7511_003575 [Penicillium nucicola]|uniref:uncharacterized protein n=1 Tax=Penicillium nucicola TaxID=1850975 RepID=UPI0025450B61|nr:uncharacterized protein N7511_003575 [Penicillium nucicola]KAJ5765959.1 hypothetical protein N7511_003575 [Penicillium nucicola]
MRTPRSASLSNKWDELSASALTSEANTMRLLKRQTTIPLPDILDFSSTTQNPLRCPYIIMSFISGISLYNIWFGGRLEGVSPDTTHLSRIRALESIASAMAQLDSFSFRTSGRVVFDNHGNSSQVKSMRRVDHKATLDRWFVHKVPADDPIYIKFAASSDPKEYYSLMLDIHPEHNKLDIQNFIVSEDGELLGVIDWDGVAAVPRTLGNERYTGWPTRDWDQAMYDYQESMEDGVEPEVREGGSEVNLCRMSLIAENLAIAVDQPRCRNGILRKLLQEIWNITELSEQLDLMELAEMFAEGNVDTEVIDSLQSGFIALLGKKGL